MAADLVLDDREWRYPGGSCRLLVWRDNDPADGFTCAVLSLDETAAWTTLAHAMERIYPLVQEQYGTDVQVFQHQVGTVRHEIELVRARNRGYGWSPASMQEVADDLEMTRRALLALLEA